MEGMLVVVALITDGAQLGAQSVEREKAGIG
jgi:hypothetical protein